KKILAISLIALTLTACKPTEENYKKAYDAAKAKRELANAEAMMPTTGLLSDDGISLKVVDGDSIFVSHERLRVDPELKSELKTYSVAVGVYKMNTNAKAQANSLKQEGYKAFASQTTGERWYTILGSFDKLEEAKKLIFEFKKKNPDYPYIGLPNSPVVIGR
ncbi:MAG: SPOR domain-containing protein, partial [Muribaculaceae bacterium]|nr:SPOR domain-containing protein [Muribaculaceae bacterium]